MTSPLPLLTRFEMNGKRYVINGYRTIGLQVHTEQYECICISGPLTRRWLPRGEVHAAIERGGAPDTDPKEVTT